MGQKVFANGITITDDPFLKRGPRSHPFDAEGLLPQRRAMIDDGILTGWFLDLSSAAQLKLKSTGNAARGASSGPSPRPANLTLQAGSASPQDFIAEIKQGFFVTELMGQGANLVTGDYSRGARGFWIENGKIAYPVSEVTIAGNIVDIWAGLQPANDLKIEYGIDSPTLLLPPMMVAGS
jgi:PmbA protein